MCVCESVWVCTYIGRCLWIPEEGGRPTGAGVTDSYEPPGY